jgi:hypothetical protein
MKCTVSGTRNRGRCSKTPLYNYGRNACASLLLKKNYVATLTKEEDT